MIRGQGQRGFTLLEVMVAIAILAGALLAVSDLVGSSLRNHLRAIHLETATVLARGKLAALEDGYERTGFRDFSQTEEGSFEDEGHAEVKWKLEVVKPQVDLGPEHVLKLLGGAGDLGTLLGQGLPSGPSGSTGATGAKAPQAQGQNPMAGLMAGPVNQQLTIVGEQIKKGVRELRLTVSWPEGKATGSFTVVTHMVVINPRGP